MNFTVFKELMTLTLNNFSQIESIVEPHLIHGYSQKRKKIISSRKKSCLQSFFVGIDFLNSNQKQENFPEKKI